MRKANYPNRERIKWLSEHASECPETLAEYLVSHGFCCKEKLDDDGSCYECSDECRKCVEKWLDERAEL